MTIRELQGDFQLEVQNYDQPGIIISDVIFYWLNEALLKLTATYYSNDKESFEQTQRVTDVLKRLVTEVTIVPAAPIAKYGVQVFTVTLPTNYMTSLNERVTIEMPNPNDANLTVVDNTDITDSTSSTLNRQLTDPYSTHRVHYESARPLRLFIGDTVDLYTDGSYTITEYFLRYLRTPTILALPPKDEPDRDFTDLPSNIHHDLVALAAKMYADSVKGSEAPPRQKELQAIKGKLIQTK